MTDVLTPLRNKEILSVGILVMIFALVLPELSFGQDKDYTPDGTQGEMLELVSADTLPKKWKDKRWRLFPGKFTTFKFGGGFLYEFAGYSQNSEGKRQMDSIGSKLEPAFAVRDFRITMSGQLKKSKRLITWKAGKKCKAGINILQLEITGAYCTF